MDSCPVILTMPNQSSYTTELASDICLKMIDGHSLREISMMEGFPSRSTIYVWTTQFPEFRTAIARARMIQVDMLVDECKYIADTTVDAHRAKNMIQVRQWLAGVLKPKEYGPKLDITVNEKPSIKHAIDLANERLPRPVRDQLTHDNAQVIEDTLDFESRLTGSQPADDTQAVDFPEIDPFS